MPSQQAETLLDLLDREAAALKQAQYATLPGLQDKIATQITALAATSPSPELLDLIRSRLATNQSLLQSALRGITSARNRIAALEGLARGFDTYDRDGGRETVHTGRPLLERKA